MSITGQDGAVVRGWEGEWVRHGDEGFQAGFLTVSELRNQRSCQSTMAMRPGTLCGEGPAKFGSGDGWGWGVGGAFRLQREESRLWGMS